MSDRNKHDQCRAFLSKERQPTADINAQSRSQPRFADHPCTPSEPRAMREALALMAELIAYSPAQNRAQGQRPFMQRPATGMYRPADVLGQDAGASNLAEYATENNSHKLPRSMADGVHTLGPVIAQLKWKQVKEDEKKRDAEEGRSLPPAKDEPASGRRSDTFRGPSGPFKAFAIPAKRKRAEESEELPTDAGNEYYNCPAAQLARWSAQKTRAAVSNSVKELFSDLVAAKRQEKLRSQLPPPERLVLGSITNEQQKPLTPPKAFLASLPQPPPIKIPFFTAPTPPKTTLPPSSPTPTMSFEPSSSQFMMNQLSSPIVSSAFIPQGFQAMLSQTSSPNRLAGLQPGAPLPILSVYQNQTIDGLARDIRRHSTEVDIWFAAWKTPIELGFDHMIQLRDHEMLALRMAIEFGRVEEIDLRLVRMSDELYDSAVKLYDRTLMFLAETAKPQEVWRKEEEH